MSSHVMTSMGNSRRAASAGARTAKAKEDIASDMEELAPARGWSTIKLLMTLSVMLGVAVVAAFAVIALLVVGGNNQHTRIDNLGTKTIQQQEQINRLDDRVSQLERSNR